MAKRESYIDSMAGMPDGTQEAANKDESQEVRETPTTQEAQEAPQPTGTAKAFLEMYSKYASNYIDVTAGQTLQIPGLAEELREYENKTGQSTKETIGLIAKITAKTISKEWLDSKFEPEINLSDSLNSDTPKDVLNDSLYVRIFNSLLFAARADRTAKEEKAKAAGKELPGETDNARQILSKAATDYFFLVNYEKLRPMDGGRLTKARQEEATRYYRRMKEYAAGKGISDIEKALYPKGITRDAGLLPMATPEYLQFIFEFSESEKATDGAAALEPRVIAERITELAYPLDKVNSLIWIPDSMKAAEDGYYHIAAEKENSRKEIDILYKINFDEKEKQLDAETQKWISTKKSELPQLTAKTKRVMIACNELYKHGNIFSITQIYHAMGYEGMPGAKQMEEINEELGLLSTARIILDNSQEVEAGYKYPSFHYEGTMMPNERIKAFINGKWTPTAVHVFRQPPLMEFAEGRKQITSIDIGLLQAPIKRTKTTTSIEDYLLRRIARMKQSEKQSRKILYTAIHSNCGITDKKAKQRAINTAGEILKHYEERGYIKDFCETPKKDGVNIAFSKK